MSGVTGVEPQPVWTRLGVPGHRIASRVLTLVRGRCEPLTSEIGAISAKLGDRVRCPIKGSRSRLWEAFRRPRIA